jgi:hypothetical protein
MVEGEQVERRGAVAMSLMIHPEATDALEASRHLNPMTFGRDEEARLVDSLRDGGHLRRAWVQTVYPLARRMGVPITLHIGGNAGSPFGRKVYKTALARAVVCRGAVPATEGLTWRPAR